MTTTSAKQTKLLSQANADRFGRIYQADIQSFGRTAGRTASAWHRSCQALVRRGMLIDVSSAGVYQITDKGRECLKGSAS